MNNNDLDSPSSLDDYYSSEVINVRDTNYNEGTDDDVDNNNGFNVTIEEAVFKYVRGIEPDYTNNIPDGNHNFNIVNHKDTISNDDDIYDYPITNQYSISPECNSTSKDDKTCESLHFKSRNKRELDETDKSTSLKRIRVQNDIGRGEEFIEEDSGLLEKQNNLITKGLSIEDKGYDLLSSVSYESMSNRNMLLPTLNEEDEVSQPYSSLLMGRHYLNILPKAKQVENDDCFGNSQSKISKSRKLRKLVETYMLEVLKLGRSSKCHKDSVLEEERIMKNFVQRYQEIYDLSYYDIRYIILNDFMNEKNILTSEDTSNNKDNNKIDIKIIDYFWSSLYKIFPGHSHSSLNKRIYNLIRSSCKKSKWTNEEDKLLRDMCTIRGLLGKWNHIGYILNRTPEDCRNRWRDYGICQGNQKKNQWTVEEEEQLFKIIIDLLKKFTRIEQKNQTIKLDANALIHNEQLFRYAINWNQVSKFMGYTRSRIQCQYKWKKLLRRTMLQRINDGMTNNDIRRILSIIENRWTKVNDIDWHHLSNELNSNWYAKELELFFNTRLKKILNHEQLTIKEVCRKILRELDD